MVSNKQCMQCKKEFTVSKDSERKYCSKDCYIKVLKKVKDTKNQCSCITWLDLVLACIVTAFFTYMYFNWAEYKVLFRCIFVYLKMFVVYWKHRFLRFLIF